MAKPGLNEHGTRTRVTMDYLLTVDAVLFVVSCQALGSKSEMDAIDQNVRGAGHEDVFFICNRFDEIRERVFPLLIGAGVLQGYLQAGSLTVPCNLPDLPCKMHDKSLTTCLWLHWYNCW
jgi:hypothetical protein